MAWVGVVDGRVLPVHWLTGSVNAAAYLQMLQTVVWPAVRGSASKKQYWFQQDGASVHCTFDVIGFMKSKFGTRIISRKTEHHWPPYSPDLNPLDFSFWSQAMSHMVRCQPITLDQLKEVVEDFTTNFDPEEVLSMARHTRHRAQLCKDVVGGHFEHLVKKSKV